MKKLKKFYFFCREGFSTEVVPGKIWNDSSCLSVIAPTRPHAFHFVHSWFPGWSGGSGGYSSKRSPFRGAYRKPVVHEFDLSTSVEQSTVLKWIKRWQQQQGTEMAAPLEEYLAACFNKHVEYIQLLPEPRLN